MKLLTTNFLTCAIKSCKSSPLSFPLHFRDAVLQTQEIDYDPLFLNNVLPRLDWEGLRGTAMELGFTHLPETKPEPFSASPSISDPHPHPQPQPQTDPSTPSSSLSTSTSNDSAPALKQQERDQLLRELHTLLLETEVVEGSLVCGNCGHEYKIKEGIANFLLPSHLV